MKNKTTVVIPNYNGIDYLGHCLDSIMAQSLLPEIIIVDNGSTDGSLEIARDYAKRYSNILVMEEGHNTGFCHAVNTGIQSTVTEFVLLLNNDTIAERDVVEKLQKSIMHSKRIFSVGAKLLMMNDKNHRIDSAGDLYCALGWAFAPDKNKKSKQIKGLHSCTSNCAAAAIYRREVFNEIGYFDESHFCYLEDVDIGYRARIYGYSNICNADAIVFHAGSASSGSMYNDFKQRQASANNLYFLYKNMPFAQLIINSIFLLFGIIVKAVFFYQKGLLVPYLRGLGDGISKISDNLSKKVPLKLSHVPNYVLLQFELWVNMVRRITG